ncbi:hypothetical protein E2C01_073923 [Portunus trituberculatus]|uniref:Uncharacterized protein n=1 Tax=Portunus trituberculatus TaxID=210409 RepID=A0A5B7ICZ1_PORTR|nr:hypothetical protein [Portunus trituberculatus]
MLPQPASTLRCLACTTTIPPPIPPPSLPPLQSPLPVYHASCTADARGTEAHDTTALTVTRPHNDASVDCYLIKGNCHLRRRQVLASSGYNTGPLLEYGRDGNQGGAVKCEQKKQKKSIDLV